VKTALDSRGLEQFLDLWPPAVHERDFDTVARQLGNVVGEVGEQR
jgi:hypothetical protein